MSLENGNVDELINKSLAIRKGSRYYLVKGPDGEPLLIGKSKAEANKALSTMVIEDKTPSSSSILVPPEALKEATSKTKKETEALDDEATEENLNFDSILDDIIDIKPSVIDSLAVYYRGCHISLDKDRYGKRTIVGNLPVTFRWRKRGNNNANVIDDGGGGNLSCKGWQVFMPKRGSHKKLFKQLRFMRNDTPNGEFITNDELVFCIASREQYERGQKQKSINGLMSALEDKESRMQLGKDIGKLSNENEAIQLLEKQNSSDIATQEQMDDDITRLKAQL